MQNYNCDIIGVCETWLNDTVNLNAFSSDYQVFRQDRNGSRGGGVLLAIKDTLKCNLVKQCTVGNCECIFVDVLVNSSEYMRYGLIYRPPDTSLDNSRLLFDTVYDCLENVKLYTLLGDFNLPDIDWSDYSAASQISREFVTLCFKLGAQQCVDFPTRHNNVIDLILCPSKNLIQSINAETPFSTSDHNMIQCKMINHSRSNRETVLKPCYKAADYELINAFLATINWDEVYSSCNSTEEYWAAFKNVIDTAVLNFVPFVTVSKHKQAPWFSNTLKRLHLIKQRRWRKYFNARNIVKYAEYRAAASHFKSEFIKSKANYEKKLFDGRDNNPAKFYGYVKSQNRICMSIPTIKKADGSLASSDYDKSCEFVNYFSSVFVQDNNVLPDFEPNCADSLESFTCQISDIVKIVMKLKNNSAPGPDGITVYFLKNTIAQIASPLCMLFNKSLNEGSLPTDWKTAYITPIFKKGDPQKASQYRPVSLTSIVCKILERVIREQLLDYMFRNNIVPKNQHGFLPKRSTVSNLLECLNDWTRNFDDTHAYTDIIYLDYSKCFDTVCHSKLLYKLSKYGISGSAYKWLESFLVDRTHQVKINDTLSPPASVSSGVPQGTVLGPLLFLYYSADLPNVVLHSSISIYADDTKLYKCIKSEYDCSLLQSDLNRVFNWASEWQLKLNPDKTKRLTIGICKYPFDYKLNGTVIENVNSICDVGVTIQSNLKFTLHCNNVIKKAHYTIRNIFNTFKHHDKDFYMTMYTCYVRPILESACQVWSPITKSNIDRIENVQRYYTRRIPGMNNLSYMERLNKLKLDSIECRRIRSDLILFYKMINDHTFIRINRSYSFVYRHRAHSKHLYTFYSRTDKRKYFWINRIVSVWNNLPDDTVNSTSVNIFRRCINPVQFQGRGSIYCD